jgi:hypothetical protein
MKSEEKGNSNASHFERASRPLKMPKNYDFSVRNTNWNQYKHDFLLRTDAVWEKTKLKDVFYSFYKTMLYDNINNRYMVANIRILPLPTNEPEQIDEWKTYMGYTQSDGVVVSIQ